MERDRAVAPCSAIKLTEPDDALNRSLIMHPQEYLGNKDAHRKESGGVDQKKNKLCLMDFLISLEQLSTHTVAACMLYVCRFPAQCGLFRFGSFSAKAPVPFQFQCA